MIITRIVKSNLQTGLVFAFDWITGLCFFVGIYYIIRTIKRIICCEFKIRDKHNILIGIIIIIGCLYIPIAFNIGNTQIGHIYEKDEYTENYMVVMSTQPENASKRTQYILPATIYRNEDFVDWDGNTELRYHIYRLFFSNGGYLEFNEINNTIYPGKEVKIMDTNNNYYYITLTRNKYKE